MQIGNHCSVLIVLRFWPGGLRSVVREWTARSKDEQCDSEAMIRNHEWMQNLRASIAAVNRVNDAKCPQGWSEKKAWSVNLDRTSYTLFADHLPGPWAAIISNPPMMPRFFKNCVCIPPAAAPWAAQKLCSSTLTTPK